MFYIIWAILIGILIAIQGSTNTALRIQLDSPWAAGLVNFIGGVTILIIVVIIAYPETFANMKPIFQGEVPLWKLWGGLVGAFFIVSVTVLVPHIGIGKLVILYLVGQIVMSIIIDHFGLFGMPIDKLSAQKAIGLVLLIAGVILTQKKQTSLKQIKAVPNKYVNTFNLLFRFNINYKLNKEINLYY